MKLKNQFFHKNNAVITHALFLTIIGALIIYLQQGEINRDGIKYITEAQFFLERNYTKAFEGNNWPFFSYLISKVSDLLDISVQLSAHIINLMCFGIAALFFLKTISYVSNKQTSAIWGSLILLSSIPVMDDYLPMVLRDQGQWAGFMGGVYYFLKWFNEGRVKNAIFWQLSFAIGTLFRPECLAFNMLLPFVSLLLPEQRSVEKFLQSISLGLVAIIILVIAYFISDISIELARLNEFYSRPRAFLLNILTPLELTTNHIDLRYLIADFSESFKFLFIAYVILYKWIAGLGIFHFAVFYYALKHQLMQKKLLLALVFLFLISGAITIINTYATYILANRYWVMNWWVVYIFAALGLSHLWSSLNAQKSSKHRWIKISLVFVLLFYFLNVILDKPQAHFEKQAGNWVMENHLDFNNIYFNNRRVAYYAGQLAFDDVGLQQATEVIQYRYLMIRYPRFSEVKDIKNYQPIHHLPSKQNPKVIVYERVSHD